MTNHSKPAVVLHTQLPIDITELRKRFKAADCAVAVNVAGADKQETRDFRINLKRGDGYDAAMFYKVLHDVVGEFGGEIFASPALIQEKRAAMVLDAHDHSGEDLHGVAYV